MVEEEKTEKESSSGQEASDSAHLEEESSRQLVCRKLWRNEIRKSHKGTSYLFCAQNSYTNWTVLFFGRKRKFWFLIHTVVQSKTETWRIRHEYLMQNTKKIIIHVYIGIQLPKVDNRLFDINCSHVKFSKYPVQITTHWYVLSLILWLQSMYPA